MKQLVILFTLCTTTVFSQTDMTPSESDLKGKVKNLTSISTIPINGVVDDKTTRSYNIVNYNKMGNPTYMISYYGDSVRADRTRFTYNQLSKEILRVTTTSTGENKKIVQQFDSILNKTEKSFYLNDVLYWVEDWIYDEKNRLISHSHKDSGWPEYWEYAYDSTGNCVLEDFSRDSRSTPHLLQTRTIRIYKNGRLVEEQISKSDIARIVYEYDNLNKLISKIEYNANGDLDRKETFKYSSDLLVEESHYSLDKLTFQKQMKYNSKKQLIELIEINNVMNAQRKIVYTYDAQSNWIVQKSYDLTTGLISYQIERKISYY